MKDNKTFSNVRQIPPSTKIEMMSKSVTRKLNWTAPPCIYSKNNNEKFQINNIILSGWAGFDPKKDIKTIKSCTKY